MESIAYTIPRYPNIGFLEKVDTTWLIIPKPGSIRMYTSGCPKNQNRCWNKIGSPPPAGSKKVVLKFLSVRSIVIPPASTGNDNNSRKAVISTDHTKSGSLCIVMPGPRMLNIVVIKFIAPKILLIPDRWRLKIAKSTAPPEWLAMLLNGGYHFCWKLQIHCHQSYNIARDV